MGAGFSGKHSHSIDAKGRMIVPAKFREKLGENFIMTLGVDGCLKMYPLDQWERFLEQFEKLPGTRDARRVQRYFMSNAEDCEIDKQGRVLIPAELREKAGLVKDIVSVGNINGVEIWSKERWEEADTADAMEEMVESLAGFGIRY